MKAEPVFETLNLRKSQGDVVNKVKIDCRTEIPSDTVRKVIHVSQLCDISGGDIVKEKAEFFGRVNFFILYETSEGEIKKCECGAEFKDVLESPAITEDCRIKFSCNTEKTETSLSGVNLAVSAIVAVKGEVFSDVKLNVLTGGEGIIINEKETPVLKSYAAVPVVYPVEEEFEVNYKISQVLGHRAQVAVTAIQCGVSTVICDGEIYLTEIFLQSGEKKDIIREDKTIPFRVELENEAAMPSLTANATARVKSLKTDVSVDEEAGVSTVRFAVTVEVLGEAESLETANIALDAFCEECELNLNKETAEILTEVATKHFNEKVKERCSVYELPETAVFCTVIGESAEIVSVDKRENGVNVIGTVLLTSLYLDGGEIVPRKTEFPFEKFLETEEDFDVAEVCVSAFSAFTKIHTLTEIEAEADLAFTVNLKKRHGISYISSVTEGEAKTPLTAAVSVYIPIEGEGLWELAKRLNVSPQKLVSTNGDLQFPLTGKERIVVFRQK